VQAECSHVRRSREERRRQETGKEDNAHGMRGENRSVSPFLSVKYTSTTFHTMMTIKKIFFYLVYFEPLYVGAHPASVAARDDDATVNAAATVGSNDDDMENMNLVCINFW